MPQMRRMRRFPRRRASAFVILSPAYSAILRPRGKGIVAKQPLPLMDDFSIARPAARFSLIANVFGERQIKWQRSLNYLQGRHSNKVRPASALQKKSAAERFTKLHGSREESEPILQLISNGSCGQLNRFGCECALAFPAAP